jgi:hypothetical protein
VDLEGLVAAVPAAVAVAGGGNNMNNAILIHGTCDREEYFDLTCPSLSNSH